MNHSTKPPPGIKLAIDWVKGLKMDIPYSRWVMFSIGVYVIAAAVSRLAGAMVTIAPIFR